MTTLRLVICVLLASLALAPCAQAAPDIAVNGLVGPELAPPTGSNASDAESGAPLARAAVSVTDQLAGVWQYSAVSDITVPKLAIYAAVNNSAGDALTGAFGGELALMRVNSTLSDTLTIVPPSADPYLVTAVLDIHGVYQLDGSTGTVVALLTLDPVNQLSNSKSKTYTGNGVALDDQLSISFQFVGDATFDLSSQLFFFVNHIDAGTSIVADFSNTAIINLSVTTLGGAPLPNVVVTSSSGNFGSAPVPLPATLPLLVSALVILGWKERRRPA